MLMWAPIPLVRVAIVFSAGILLGIYQQDIVSVRFAVSVALIAGTGFMLSLFLPKSWRKYGHGIFSWLVIFWLGYVLVHVRTDSLKPQHVMHQSETILAYRGVVVDHLYERKSSWKTTVKVNAIKTGAGWLSAKGSINIYIQQQTYQGNLYFGSHVVVAGAPTPIAGPANPHEFDFKRFLTFRNITHQHFVSGTNIIPTGQIDKGFLYYSSYARTYFTGIIKTYVWGKQEQAIALALIIGVTDGIDNELENAYSASGAMHVLAVSGLHIGILYWILLLILKPLNRSVKGMWAVAIISLLVLWGYSFVTGLSPSVLRAVTMFSFVALAKPWQARSNIFNTLAGSAVFLLLFDPYLIMSVGFQLSYLAVLGIIWIQRPLFLLWEANNLFMSKVWEITCISIAAQLTTFSLGLLYFHQFPTYFLVSNLFVIPLSFVVLVAGIALLLFSWVTPLATAIGAVVWASVKLLNLGVFWVEKLPVSIINNIYIDVFQCWIIMGLVATLILTWQQRNIGWFYVAIALALVLTGARWMHQTKVLPESKMIVYHVRGSSVIEFFDRGVSRIIGDSSFLSDAERVRFHIRPNRLYSLIKQSDTTYATSQQNIILTFQNEPVLILRKPIINKSQQVNAKLIVVSSKALWDVPILTKAWPNAFFVLDGTCSSGQLRWLNEQKIDRSRWHSVIQDGYYERVFINKSSAHASMTKR
jgi:competence protein ComEC